MEYIVGLLIVIFMLVAYIAYMEYKNHKRWHGFLKENRGFDPKKKSAP